jgi:hypothetical protein
MIALHGIEQHAPPYTDGSITKLFSENRARYIEQSAATARGKVAQLPGAQAKPLLPKLPQPRWKYTRPRLFNGLRDCRECEGTGVYSPGLDPQYDRPCPTCKGECVNDWIGPDPLEKMRELRRWDRTRYARIRTKAMRPVRLP